MNETDVKKVAKKIQNVQTFQELHNIMVAYVNLAYYSENYSENAPADYLRRCPSPRSPVDYEKLRPSLAEFEEWDPFENGEV